MELGETPEKWVAVIQPTTNKSISHKYRNIVSKKLPDMSEITSLTKQLLQTFWACLDKEKLLLTFWTCLDKEKSELNHTPKFFTESTGQSGLPKISIGKHAFNLSLCLFEPKMINWVLSGFNLSLLVDIHSLTSRHLFNCSKAANAFFWDKGT